MLSIATEDDTEVEDLDDRAIAAWPSITARASDGNRHRSNAMVRTTARARHLQACPVCAIVLIIAEAGSAASLSQSPGSATRHRAPSGRKTRSTLPPNS